MSAFLEALALDARAAYARAWVRVVGSFRQLDWIISDAVLPNLGMCAFVLLYRALGAPKSYEALAVIGGVLSTFWINVLWGMGAQLYWEKQQGQLQLYFAAPCSRMAILTGMAAGGLAATILRSGVGVALGLWVFQVRLEPFSPWLFTAVFLLTMTALYALGMTLASLFLLYGREAWHTCNALMEPVYFLSGLYFPIRTLGALGAVAAGVLPLTLGVDALRQVLLGEQAHGLLPVHAELAALAGFTVVFLFAARFALGWLERLAKREGRLTLRWQ
ncbi:MAG: ABC transporter permease [Candidatus Eisenbacteria bacterium]|nr:ABC transporter permease [Candidatus Eisenbacteria bacterium]